MAGISHPSSESQYQSTIQKLKRSGVNWGWEIRRIYTDDSGIFCIRFKTDRSEIYTITKGYIFLDEYASFPTRVIHRAQDHEKPVAIFFGDQPRLGNGYVFDPVVVEEFGCANMANTPRFNREEWIDISISKGVLVGHYISYHSDLPTVAEFD